MYLDAFDAQTVTQKFIQTRIIGLIHLIHYYAQTYQKIRLIK